MKLPNWKNVIILREKLSKYLLSETHPLGMFKAKFFRNLGFNNKNVTLLEKSLRIIAQSGDVVDMVSSDYGTKYVIDGEIKTPSREVVKLKTVWIIEKGEKRPRFVTTYPV